MLLVHGVSHLPSTPRGISADGADHPVLVLDSTLDLACVETQISTGVRQDPDARDCELLSWEGEEVFGRIAVPEL